MPTPTIPNLIQDSAQLEVGSGRQRISADANAFGASEARAIGGLGESVAKVGEVAADLDDDYNEANARELDNELSRRVRERLYNTNDGYLSTRRGRAAIDDRPQVEADLDAIAQELAPQARNARAGMLFRDVASRRLASALGSVASHAAQENTAYQNEVSEARLNEFMDNAVAAYGDPAAVAAQVDGGIGELQSIGRRLGWDDEILSGRVRRLQSDISSRVILQLAASDPEAAEEMYTRIRPTLSAQEAGELLTTMRAARRQGEDDLIDEAWTHVAAGQRVPPELWSRVPGRAQIDIQNELRRRAEGGDGGGDRALISDLNVMSVADPRGFSRYDLRAVRSQLGETAYQHLAEDQARIRNGGARSGANESTLSSARRIATRHLRVNGFNVTSDGDPSADAEEDEVRRLLDFESDLIGMLDRFVEENGNRQPNAQEQSLAIQGLLAAHAHDPTPGFGRDRRTWTSSETYVPYAQIPQSDRAAIEAALRARGQSPTRGRVERIYEQSRIDRQYGRGQ